MIHIKKQYEGKPANHYFVCDPSSLADAKTLSDAELKIRLEENGYRFRNTFQARDCYIHRKIADSDVLISIGQNIADFYGYVEMNASAATLWEALQAPRTASELEKILKSKYGISHKQAVADVLDFLKLLRHHDMIIVYESEPGDG